MSADVVLTAHFSAAELACHDGTPYPLDRIDADDPEGRTWRETRAMPLCETLEAIREAAGGVPIHVSSGYRTPAYNRRLGSHDTSQHPQGRAADITHPTITPRRLWALILGLYKDGKLPRLGGLGSYRGFVHLDVRPRPEDGHLAQWTGRRASNVAAAVA